MEGNINSEIQGYQVTSYTLQWTMEHGSCSDSDEIKTTDYSNDMLGIFFF